MEFLTRAHDDSVVADGNKKVTTRQRASITVDPQRHYTPQATISI